MNYTPTSLRMDPRPSDFSTCDSTTYFGDFPGDAAKCACDDARVRAGVLCELPCPPAPNYCGAGRCSHVLDGRRFDDTTALERSNDFPFCACDVGWVGAVCELPCPGTADHPVSPGPYACLGRGTCSQGAVGARCQCVSGYMGDRCQVREREGVPQSIRPRAFCFSRLFFTRPPLGFDGTFDDRVDPSPSRLTDAYCTYLFSCLPPVASPSSDAHRRVRRRRPQRRRRVRRRQREPRRRVRQRVPHRAKLRVRTRAQGGYLGDRRRGSDVLLRVHVSRGVLEHIRVSDGVTDDGGASGTVC